jgi:YidC/Oxa1 family membrane protein insertase
MDKNTIYGLIMMGVIFFAFMWLTPTEDKTSNSETTSTEQVANQTATTAPEFLNETEIGWLTSNIRENGKVNDTESGRIYTLAENGLNLNLAGDSIYGTITVDGQTVAWSDVNNPSSTAVTPQQQKEALELIRNTSNSIGRYGKFSRFLTGTDSIVMMENDAIKLRLNAKSGSITYAELKKYDTEYHADETVMTKRKVVLFDGKSDAMNFDIPMPQAVNTSDLYFTPKVLNDSTVLMALDFDGGAYWGIRYTLPKGENYVIKMDIVQSRMNTVAQSNNHNLGFHWHQNVARQERGRQFEERNSALYYKFAGGKVESLSESKNDSEERQAKIRWIGFKNQFFSSVIVADRAFNTADFNSEVLKDSDYLKSLSTSAIVNDYDWSADKAASFSLYLGPNLYPLLSSLDDKINVGEDLKLTRLIPLAPFGWGLFRWINTCIVIPVFNFIGTFTSNYGIVILILTLFIKLILFPLTIKSYKSQAKMRILAPDIKAINDKYPGQENAMIRQQKTMELYNRAGASPMSGCLPMLLQMPILFAMFSFFPSCIELRGQSFLWAHDLSAPDAIISWSGNIPFITTYFGNHISLFCLLMTITNIIYTHINMQNSASSMPGMKWMMYLMPVFFLVFFNNYAAGLSYYYFLSLLITIIQTYVFRNIVKEEDVRKLMAENAKKPKKKSGWVARMEEMQRQQQQMMREQQKRKK